MKIRIHKVAGYLFFSCIGVFLLLIYFPRTYDVPAFHMRKSTLTWNLSTGSHVGYTFCPAKGTKRPFPVIYLHGGPGGHTTDYYIKNLSRLSEDGYDIYFYDQVGSGQSERLKDIRDYTPDRHKRDLEEIIKTIGADRVILIGQSWGAILAVLFIADNPSKVEKIIFTCPGPIFPVRKELANIKAPDSLMLRNPVFTNELGNKKANNLRTKAMVIFATLFKKKLASDQEADQFETYLNGEVDKSTVADTSKILKADAGGGFYARVMTFDNLLHIQDPRAKIKGLNIPILILKAQYDNQKWGFTHEYCELFPNHRIVIIPESGHYILAEQPELYLSVVRNFLH